jgi:hypothetical protein
MMLRMIAPRRALALAVFVTLLGCDRGMSDCERATRNALANPESYQKIAAKEDPGLTPAMTYYVIDYMATDAKGRRVREQVYCSYWGERGEVAGSRLVSSVPVR